MRSISIVVWAIEGGGFCHDWPARVCSDGAVERRESAQPPRARDGRIARHGRARGDVADDAALRRDPRAISDGDVIGDADLSPDPHSATERDRSREAGLRGDEGPGADVAVVPDVDLGVDLHAAPEDRGTEAPRVDRAERAD